MNAAHQPTVQWLPELAPTVEARTAALGMFETQTGAPPQDVYVNMKARIWGCISTDAVLLFRIPDDWQPEGTLKKVAERPQSAESPIDDIPGDKPPVRPLSSSQRTHHRVTG